VVNLLYMYDSWRARGPHLEHDSLKATTLFLFCGKDVRFEIFQRTPYPTSKTELQPTSSIAPCTPDPQCVGPPKRPHLSPPPPK